MRHGASREELRQVYERRLPELRRVAAAIVGERELARDVVQDAFVRAVRQRRSFSGRGSLEAWVWRIVVNCARDARARGRRLEPVEMVADLTTAAGDDAEEREAVRAAVELLPERQRLVLFLRAYADLSQKTVAETLGISEGTVAATLHAAHGRLRQLLSEVAQ